MGGSSSAPAQQQQQPGDHCPLSSFVVSAIVFSGGVFRLGVSLHSYPCADDVFTVAARFPLFFRLGKFSFLFFFSRVWLS
eukprot:m.308335 g.308335  ORF g.308335 m.308335 type:complete len:80 (-) comp55327_c0_seq36:1535-1774(-)